MLCLLLLTCGSTCFLGNDPEWSMRSLCAFEDSLMTEGLWLSSSPLAGVGVDVAVGTLGTAVGGWLAGELLLFGRFRTSSPEGVMSKSEGKIDGWSWTCLLSSLRESWMFKIDWKTGLSRTLIKVLRSCPTWLLALRFSVDLTLAWISKNKLTFCLSKFQRPRKVCRPGGGNGASSSGTLGSLLDTNTVPEFYPLCISPCPSIFLPSETCTFLKMCDSTMECPKFVGNLSVTSPDGDLSSIEEHRTSSIFSCW